MKIPLIMKNINNLSQCINGSIDLTTTRAFTHQKHPRSLGALHGVQWTPRGTHMLRHTGMCRIFGSFFWKKSLNMGPIFHAKIPNYGFDFIGVFLWQNRKKWVPFFGKIPNHGYLFLEKLPLSMGMGFELPVTDPRLIQSWKPPGSGHFQYTPRIYCKANQRTRNQVGVYELFSTTKYEIKMYVCSLQLRISSQSHSCWPCEDSSKLVFWQVELTCVISSILTNFECFWKIFFLFGPPASSDKLVKYCQTYFLSQWQCQRVAFVL